MSSDLPAKSEPDFRCENHGSLFLLVPISESAQSWVAEHLPEDRMTFGDGFVVDHRYIWAILEALQSDGLRVVPCS